MTHFNIYDGSAKEEINYFGNYDIMNLGEIIRYNNRAKIRKENVSEHSFYVVTNVIKICKAFKIPINIRLEAIELAAVHDIPELFLGDVPYTTKRDNPMLAEILEQAELNQLRDNMPEFYEQYNTFIEMEKEGTLQFLIVKLADIISVLQYSNNEIELGNTSKSMKEINDDAKIRVEIYIHKLKCKLRESYSPVKVDKLPWIHS